jgi:acetyl-CoA acyltransferase
MSEQKVKELDLKPLAVWRGLAVAGVEPELMGIGPIKAIPKVLKQVGLTLDQIDLFELNEAFAAQGLAVIKTLGIDPAKVNPNGGAIAFGHPLGCTGAKLTATLLHELKRRGLKYGMVTMCIGGGMGAAGIYEIL